MAPRKERKKERENVAHPQRFFPDWDVKKPPNMKAGDPNSNAINILELSSYF